MPWPFYTATEKREKALQGLITDTRQEITHLMRRIDALQASLDSLQTSHASLHAQHERLRGAFYGTQGGGRPPVTSLRHLQGRDALRAAAGLRAGEAYQHPTDQEKE